jgi:CRISPR-associated protein Csx10
MPRIKIILEARGPLLLGDGLPVENVQTSRRFIAGSTLRGSLARAILRPLGLWRGVVRWEEQTPTREALPEGFWEVFLAEPPARFGFLYPTREEAGKAGTVDAFPIPLTASECKAHSGFAEEGGHGVWDRLLNNLRRIAGLEVSFEKNCPKCGEPLKRARGFAVRWRAEERYGKVEVRPRFFVRVGLNRFTETAEEGILYTLEALVPGPGGEGKEKPLSFVGHWRMSEEQWRALKTLLEGHVRREDGAYLLRIGTARARGMGKVALSFMEEPPPLPPMEERLDNFQPRDNEGKLVDPEHLYFALTLRAPLLLYDSGGRPTAKPERSVLEAYVSSLPEGLEFLAEASMVEREEWTGWSAVWALPKPVVTAIAAGSVLAFRAPEAEKGAVVAFLQEVEEKGLGERLAEGWGEVIACDPFHVKFDMGGA